MRHVVGGGWIERFADDQPAMTSTVLARAPGGGDGSKNGLLSLSRAWLRPVPEGRASR